MSRCKWIVYDEVFCVQIDVAVQVGAGMNELVRWGFVFGDVSRCEI